MKVTLEAAKQAALLDGHGSKVPGDHQKRLLNLNMNDLETKLGRYVIVALSA